MKPKYVGLLRDRPAYLCDPDKNVLCQKRSCYYLNRGECRLTLNPVFAQEEIKTNADRIRAMNDQELADYLWGVERCQDAPKFIDGWFSWLREAVSDD